MFSLSLVLFRSANHSLILLLNVTRKVQKRFITSYVFCSVGKCYSTITKIISVGIKAINYHKSYEIMFGLSIIFCYILFLIHEDQLSHFFLYEIYFIWIFSSHNENSTQLSELTRCYRSLVEWDTQQLLSSVYRSQWHSLWLYDLFNELVAGFIAQAMNKVKEKNYSLHAYEKTKFNYNREI